MSDARTFVVQLRSDLKVFVRNPAALFFTAILPVIFLTLFVSIFGNARAGGEYGNIRVSTLQVPAFIVLAVVSASFVGIVMGLVSLREDGVLKRIRGTPVAPWMVFAGRVATAFVSATIVTVVLCAIGALAFGVTLPTSTLPGLVVTLAVGAASFCSTRDRLHGARSQRGRGTGDDERDRAAAVLHLGRLRAEQRAAQRAAEDVRRHLPGQAVRRRADGRVRSAHRGGRLRRPGPARAGGVGIAGLVLAVRFFRWTPRQQAG